MKKKPLWKEALKELFGLLIFILKIPVYIYSFFQAQKKKNVQKSSKKKEKFIRESMTPHYETFDILKTYSGQFTDWENKIIKTDSKIGIIVGARGSGKTAFGVKLLENLYSKKNKTCYALGFHDKDMPSWIKVVKDINEIQGNAFVLIDEGGVLFSSRKSMSKANLFLSELVLVSRHKNLSIIFISQNSSNLDVNIIRQADYLILKPSSLLQLDFERQKIKTLYKEAAEDFEVYKKRRGITYIYSDEFRGFVDAPLPSFWNINISKSFK